MKKWFTALTLLSIFQISLAQNDAILAAPLGTIIAPSTGCALTATETVTVRIFNSGPGTINAPFDVSFNITGPINSSATETVLVGSIPMNSTLTYTFTATADLSTAGSYSMDANVTVAGDPNLTNDTYVGYSIVNNAASNGGTATGSTTVCNGTNSGNVTLAGNVGSVLNWEYSDDLGITWFNISNTTITQSYDDLTTETWYRANVQNASCAVATSTIGIIQIDPVSVGGTTSGGATPACASANSGTISLAGKVGNVIQWESSPDGVTWTVIANTATTNPYLNLPVTTRFRALVQSGVCAPAYSSQRIITINPATVGGTVTSDATECSGTNGATLTLGGQTGTIQAWQFSTDGGTLWTPIVNTTASQTYTNLTASTMYRAQVKSGACPVGFSNPATITVVANSDGGTINSSMTVCDGANDDTLVLTGFVGTILDWEQSTDGGFTFASAGTNNDSLFFTNLTTQTIYRAVVQAGTCATDNSSTVTINIDLASVGGTLTSDATVCASGNSGNIDLLGQVGTPTSWESSTDAGLTWNTISNTSLSQSYLNLLDTTLYRAVVTNGACPLDYSDTVTITVDPVTVGGTINSNTTVCQGNNSGTLTLTGETGSVLNWENSIDGGFTWVSIANTTASQGYLNLASNTLYRANLQSGICPSTLSGIVTITVDQAVDAGSILGATTVCEGANSGSLTLVGTSGTILDWETSTDGGIIWTPVGNTTTIENFTNLVTSTSYRAIGSSGVCPNDTSAIATITVDALTVGGAVTSDDIVCELANNGILLLSGHTGSVLNWEMSTDGGSTWLLLANSTTLQNYIDLNTTTSFRANVKNGVCPNVGSTPATISVFPQTVPGAVSSSTTVCQGLNFGVLTLTAFEGTVLDWEMSTDSGATWVNLTNNGLTQNYQDLLDTTWYRVIVQNGICPQDTSAIAFINLYPAPQADFVQDTVCSGLPTTFTNTTSNSSGFVTIYSWDFGDGYSSTSANPSHTYSVPGSFNTILFVMNNFGCSDTISHPIQVDASPIIDVVALTPTSFCEGDSVTIGSALDPSYNYLWSNGVTTNSQVVDSSFNYVLFVMNTATGCMNSDSIEVIVFDAPIADAGLDTTIDLGFSVVLSGSGGINYAWSPSIGLNDAFSPTPTCTTDSTRTYVLTVTDLNGCTDTDSVVVTLSGEQIITIYNIITPNGDGFNDTWYIENILNFPNNNISIFNRYGQIVHEATAYANDWDGTRNGDALPDGSYYYVIEMTDTGEIFKGTLNIVKSEN
ncbi:MAG: gliding motility-associated C-terminal domain-containing protein [Crocinitomicaceae bacterium]|nr:gliding motility-associated C-terminal domain-containing protein [Crocinitomicaceae bacterium]